MKGFLHPQEILNKLDLKEDMIAADFGSGSGGWAIPLAKILKDGKVYAIEILEEPLSALKGRMRLEGIGNIETIISDLENKNGSKLADKTCDLVLMTNILFQTANKEQAIGEAKRILKEGGKLLIVDWEKDSSLGPKKGRISSEKITQIAKKLNLKLEKEFKAGVFHYALVFTKL